MAKSRGLRAEQWFMIGVGVLGTYAVYRLVTGKPSPPKDEDIPILEKDKQPPVLGDFVANYTPPNVITKPGVASYLTGGRQFLGRVEIPPGGFGRGKDGTDLGTNVEYALLDAGFTNPRPYDISDVDSIISNPMALAEATADTRWFRGTWNGPTKRNIPLPPWIVLVWVYGSPEVAAEVAAEADAETGATYLYRAAVRCGGGSCPMRELGAMNDLANAKRAQSMIPHNAVVHVVAEKTGTVRYSGRPVGPRRYVHAVYRATDGSIHRGWMVPEQLRERVGDRLVIPAPRI